MEQEISYNTRPASAKRDIDVICDDCGAAFEAVKNIDGTYHDNFGRTTGEVTPDGDKLCALCAHMDE